MKDCRARKRAEEKKNKEKTGETSASPVQEGTVRAFHVISVTAAIGPARKALIYTLRTSKPTELQNPTLGPLTVE